jgi:hypothetical protein
MCRVEGETGALSQRLKTMPRFNKLMQNRGTGDERGRGVFLALPPWIETAPPPYYPTLVAIINGMFTWNRLISTSKRGKRKHCSNIRAKSSTGKKCHTPARVIIMGQWLHLSRKPHRERTIKLWNGDSVGAKLGLQLARKSCDYSSVLSKWVNRKMEKLHNRELRNLFTSNIVRIIKETWLRLVETAAREGEYKKCTQAAQSV